MVVGADGVRSKTRNEMWRLAENDNCNTTADRKAIRSSRSCIFGLSRGLPQVTQTQMWKHVRQDRHYLCSGAPNGLTFWFLFFKTRKQADSWDTLRYTDEEKEEYVAEFADDQVRPDLTFRDMYQAATSTALVSIEEFVLKKYYHKRVLLLGDAAHKMHPLTGQGGNAGIEDSAFLANHLKELLQTDPTPTDYQLKDLFHKLQEERRPRTEHLTQGARGLAQLESFGSPLLKYIMLHVFPKVPGENLLAGVGESMTQGDALRYLPLPARSKGLVPFDDEVLINTSIRSNKASYAWICLFVLIGSLRYTLPVLFPALSLPTISDHTPSSLQNWTTGSYFAISVFWLIESYRSSFSLTPILTPIPWILLAQYLSWEVALPIYFSFWIQSSRNRGFYYPWPRAILPAAAQAFPIAFVMAVGVSVVLPKMLQSYSALSTVNPLTIAYLTIPLLTSMIENGIVQRQGQRWEPVYQFGTFDRKYLARLFLAAFTVAGGTHVYSISQSMLSTSAQEVVSTFLHSKEGIDVGILNLLIAAWLSFTLWDLRRISVTGLSYAQAAVYTFFALALTGPGATLVAAWWLREGAWEASRQRISEDRYETVAIETDSK
ncbi:hypothetical protein BJX70DRAFT_366896 [Aspergillus crustosus]